jgi:hypothetical protein
MTYDQIQRATVKALRRHLADATPSEAEIERRLSEVAHRASLERARLRAAGRRDGQAGETDRPECGLARGAGKETE